MKIFKKIGLGLSLFVLLVSSVLAIGGGRALAAPVNESTFTNALYVITSFENNRPKTINVDIAGKTFSFIDKDTTNNILNLKTSGSEADSFICTQDDGGEGITLDNNVPKPLPGGGTSRSGYITLDYMDDSTKKCDKFTKLTNSAERLNKLSILAVYGVPGASTGTGSIGDGKADACEENSSGWEFTWAICPVLRPANKLTTELVNLFEDQLAFNVSQLGSASDKDSGNYKIHQTWSLIKNIASALVVIVMLIMVLSQAISVGPFDAYTVRKLLPRLVAVVILMQISWPLFVYVIDIVNNLGRGIADIMYLPFGGANKMDLWNLLDNAKLSDGTLAAMNWGAIAVFAFLGVAFLFTMLGLAFMAIIALLFAVITLIFRKILIITLLIFAPLALLAWTLPGTEKYWKLWRENFLKVLMMFPIIMAIIAAGRIFAYVVGTQDNSQFLNLLFIMVGFFGPLFLLPRTFKWGGQAMNLVGDRIMGVGKNMGERQKKFMDTRQQGWSAERKRRSQERYSRGQGFSWSRPWQRPVDLVRSGQVDPTLWGRRRQQAMDSYVAQGVESEEADIKAANARAQFVLDRLNPDDQDEYARQLANGRKVRLSADGTQIIRDDNNTPVTESGATLVERRAGLDQITRLGGENNINHIQNIFEDIMASGDVSRIEMMNKYKSAQAGTLFKKLPHIYKNSGYPVPGHPEHGSVHRTVDGLGAEDMTSISASAITRMSQVLQTAITEGSAPSATREQMAAANVARADMARLVSVFNAAASDSNLRGHIPPEVARRMRHLAVAAQGAPPYEGMPAISNLPSPPSGTPNPIDAVARSRQEIGVRVSPLGTISEEVTAPTTQSQNNPGVFPSPGSTWRPTSGTNTSVNPSEGETDIPHDNQQPQ